MNTRREFLRTGMSAVALGMLARGQRAAAAIQPCSETGALPLWSTCPVTNVPLLCDSVTVGGLPFAPTYSGDYFANTNVTPFHRQENKLPGGQPPPPSEEVPLAIIGGGLSGLAAAYMLREFRPIVFELRKKFGGNSEGESWAGIDYSLGGAYFISPDEDSFLDRFYRELGLDRVRRIDDDEGGAELNGQLRTDFWSNPDPQFRPAFERYAALVNQMANDTYPEIPLPEGKNNKWILDLDRRSLKDDITARLGMPVPRILESAIQSYCYSSFDAGWESLSAACGWNFIAAEEFGRWVCPGGNAYVVNELWQRLERLERPRPPWCPGRLLRAGCRIVDLRLTGDGRVQVTYRDKDDNWRSLIARKVVVCCSKHIAKHLIPDIVALDQPKFEAMWRVESRSYVVANILLTRNTRHDLYDTFLLGDGQYPTNDFDAHLWWRMTDVVDGKFARPHAHPHRGVLTIYWPLPAFESRVRLLLEDTWIAHASQIAPQIAALLPLYGLQPSDVRQVRLARWGHAMPIPRPGMIADGTAELLRRPIQDKIYFVNQDNWLLPAFETCLLEAAHFAPLIAQGL